MIIDHISNRSLYYGLGEKYWTALDFFADIAEGRINLPEKIEQDLQISNGITIRVRPIMTKPVQQCRIESHIQNVDIHFVPYGLERIGYVPLSQLTLDVVNLAEDISFWHGQCELLTMGQGFFMITFPQDAHMPCVCGDEPSFLLKLIAKIKL